MKKSRMISGIIIFAHIVFAAIIFIKKKRESLNSAFFNLLLFTVLFFIGWSISGFISNIIFEPQGFGKELNRDTISLLLLTIGEIIFYKKFYENLFIGDDKEKQ